MAGLKNLMQHAGYSDAAQAILVPVGAVTVPLAVSAAIDGAVEKLEKIWTNTKELSKRTMDVAKGYPSLPKGLERFEITGTIGRGPRSHVYKAMDKVTSMEVAIKLMKSRSETGALASEMRNWRRIQHPNVVRVLAVNNSGCQGVFICSELMASTLWDLVATNGKLSDACAKHIIRQVGSAVVYLHSKGIVHVYIKPENVMLESLSQTPVAKLGDYGVFKKNSAVLGTDLPTLYFLAPELLHVMGFTTPSADVWSLGVVLYYCLTGRVPFSENDLRLAKYKIETTGLNAEAVELILKMLEVDPKKRVRITGPAGVLQNHWLSEHRPMDNSRFCSKLLDNLGF